MCSLWQVWGLVLVSEEKRVITGAADSELRVWDITYLQEVRKEFILFVVTQACPGNRLNQGIAGLDCLVDAVSLEQRCAWLWWWWCYRPAMQYHFQLLCCPL